MSDPVRTREPEAVVAASPRVRRFWSPRRLPAAVTAFLVLAVAGVLLYDVAAVRAGRSAMAWRTWLADDLAARPVGDPWILAAGSAAVLLGLWLVVLAATPGMRDVLPMRPGTAGVRAGLDRHAAELALRDRAVEVPGVRFAQVSVTRGAAAVRAEVAFRETAEVRADLEAALAAALDELGLYRPLALSLDVRRMETG
ncbi:DUF6286 domain-containing protein [Streptomyces sp. NPDC046977]|uniref:DUF6286 domain-containing protein n=1 Tax=Streptomyces sp. NPDC046977 TaxID=3154703 RepID=UPI0033E0D4AA